MRVDKWNQWKYINKSMKSWLQDNDIEIYSKGKFIVPERLIRTLTKFTNLWLQYQKNVYIDKLDDIGKKYNKTYHRTINMNPGEVKSSISIDFGGKRK